MKKRLIAGSEAPQFKTEDVFGKQIQLSDYADSKLLLVFLRYAGCPFCNLTIHRLTVEYPLLQKSNSNVIAFVQSPPEAIINNIYGRHAKVPPFPIIADPDMHIYKKYYVQTSLLGTARSIKNVPDWVRSVSKHKFKQKNIDGSLFLVPAMFTIDKKSQLILDAQYGNSFYDHGTFTKVYESLQFSSP